VRLRAGTLAALSLVVALAGCGGSDQRTAEEPRLPPALASDLAATSEAIADTLDAGDVCEAARLADELEAAVEVAIAEGRIPAEFQEELQATAVELQDNVNCVDTTEEPQEDKGNGNGEDKDKDKGKKEGHDEDEIVTIETTEDDG
jgi:hypothetical protein